MDSFSLLYVSDIIELLSVDMFAKYAEFINSLIQITLELSTNTDCKGLHSTLD